MKIMVTLFLLLLTCAAAYADKTAYVTDRIEVNLRAGKGIKYKILRRLESGAAVTILEQDSRSGYSKIRLHDGTTGWILTRYLSNEPGSREKLRAATGQIERLKSENTRLERELEALKQAKGSLASETAELTERNTRLENELKHIRHAAAHAIEIEAERNRLRERVAEQERQIQRLELENKTLNRENSQRWFLIGAAVLAGGILLGLILPRLGWRRKRGWDSLSSL